MEMEPTYLTNRSESGAERVTKAAPEDEVPKNVITEQEHSKIRTLRLEVEKENLGVKGIDDFTLLRFLRARDMDVPKSAKMFLKYWSWRSGMLPNGYIDPSEVPNELAQTKLFMQGLDKMNRPIVVVFGAKHIPYKGNLEEFKRFVVFSLEKISTRISNEEGKFCAMADVGEWKYSNTDIRGYLAALSILQDCYPERLGTLFMIHVPYLFMTAWKLVYPLIDNNTKKKIMFVEDKHIKRTLLEHIDVSQLPEIYGGKLPLVPIQDS